MPRVKCSAMHLMHREIRQWSDEDKKKVGIDARSKTIISMALPDEVFHSIMHLKTSKEMWETICVQYEGTTEIQETRKINLVRQYESFIAVSSEIIPSQRSTLTITELDSESEDLSDPDLSEFDESLTLLTNSFKRFARKSNFRKSKGLIAEEHDYGESEESSSDEEEAANLCLMAEIKEEVEEASEPSMSYISSHVSISTNPSLPEAERSRAVDVLTIDLYNALNDKTQAENKNVHLTQELEKCHEKIRELTILEEKLKDQVIINEIISIEREQAIAALKAEKAHVEKWCKSSTKISEIINAQTPESDKTGLGFWTPQDEPKKEISMLKFGTFVTPISDTSYDQFYPSSSNSIPEEKSKDTKSADKGKSILLPQKATRKAKLKIS
ncbi:hypothetical protein L6452_18216 [Arctium lappa]|uniref:Uncharacterized protein n=1 Tax=Arctium lappa TaxID=4217 RepID=A0ACB9C5R0_ARCLA|nr:hypothetical protein L6452_18216 [Arctium lappa]